MGPTERQEARYDFPYHYLPTRDQPDMWQIARYLHWGYEYIALLDAVLTMVLHYHPKRVVDFGCGDGRLIRELLDNDPELEIIGVDKSQRALTFAHAMLHGTPRVHLFPELSSIEQSLFPVNVIVAMEVLEHIPPLHVKSVVEELFAMLHPHGIFIATVPSTNVPVHPKHYQHFSLEALLSITSDYYDCVEHQYVHRSGMVWNLIRLATVNRYFIMNNRSWLKLVTHLYKRYVMNATAETGAHIVAVFKAKPFHEQLI
jgi:2-polyprenyl-3-methyl-5-hydroxy-6-metoxy-1,4-benzoquinol methylase